MATIGHPFPHMLEILSMNYEPHQLDILGTIYITAQFVKYQNLTRGQHIVRLTGFGAYSLNLMRWTNVPSPWENILPILSVLVIRTLHDCPSQMNEKFAD